MWPLPQLDSFGNSNVLGIRDSEFKLMASSSLLLAPSDGIGQTIDSDIINLNSSLGRRKRVNTISLSDSESHIISKKPVTKPVQKTLFAFFKKLETRDEKIQDARRGLIAQAEKHANMQEFQQEKSEKKTFKAKARKRRLAAERQRRLRSRKLLMKPRRMKRLQVVLFLITVRPV
jgi:hypothetical protein